MNLPARIAALPRYVPQQFEDAAPGHRFLLYFRHWAEGEFGAYKEVRTPDFKTSVADPRERARLRAEVEHERRASLGEARALGASARAQLAALRERQQHLVAAAPAGWSCAALSTAPFATGLGNEHPTENGFAFLSPYGLPYLAGSGIKGVVRAAAQELRDEGREGFDAEALCRLFGEEEVKEPKDALRGALDFWDCFPAPRGDSLVLEIMTPHQSGYHQKGDTPHDAGQPNPVTFLAVPAGSAFDFHVVCHESRLPDELRARWRELLSAAFAHAFDWLGFGAKTAVGYGAMRTLDAPAPGRGAGAATVPLERAALVWEGATLRWDAGRGELQVLHALGRAAPVKGAEAAARLFGDPAVWAQLQKRKELKNRRVEVEQVGNLQTVLRVLD